MSSRARLESRFNSERRSPAVPIAIMLAVFVQCRALSADNKTPSMTDDAGVQARMTPAVRVFREASPAVVNLSTTKIVTVQRSFGGGMFDEMFDFPMLAPRRYKQQSVGSGFLIHQDGYLVTNAHVVDRAAEVKVTFSDGKVLDAREVAIDRMHDLAVLKVDARKPYPHLKLGRSDDLMPGESVIAIGNPLGLQNTITTGVVSAVDRVLEFDNNTEYTGLIQTDASINPGNSGGPLLNVLGELIGINTAIRGDAQNIGFAIPVDRLTELLPEMLDVERLKQAEFGIQFSGRPLKSGPRGVLVAKVSPDTPAFKAGVKAGDVITAIDNQQTPGFMQAFSLLDRTPIGQTMKFDLVHDDGQKQSVEVPLAEIPKADSSKLLARYFGVAVREMKAEDLKAIGLNQSIGMVVESVEPNSEASAQHMSPGDIMTKFGGISVADGQTLAHLVRQVNRGDRIPIQILRIRGDSILRYELALEAR